MRHEITCINKIARDNPYESITHIGGGSLTFEGLLATPALGFEAANAEGTLTESGVPWRITQEAAIEGMESKGWSFYVRSGDQAVNVILGSRSGNKYLTTARDECGGNNLLSLPECPCQKGALKRLDGESSRS